MLQNQILCCASSSHPRAVYSESLISLSQMLVIDLAMEVSLLLLLLLLLPPTLPSVLLSRASIYPSSVKSDGLDEEKKRLYWNFFVTVDTEICWISHLISSAHTRLAQTEQEISAEMREGKKYAQYIRAVKLNSSERSQMWRGQRK